MENTTRAASPKNTQQRAQQRVQQRRTQKHKNNGVIKKLLIAVLVLQIICAVELFMLLRAYAADKKAMQADTEVNKVLQIEMEEYGNDTEKPEQSSTGNSRVSETKEKDDWNLVLVNKWNEMDKDYVPELTELSEGHEVDSRIAESLMDMIHDAGKAGHTIYIISAYRDIDKQTRLYEAEVDEWRALGYSQKGAEEKAATVVAIPGTSEHHLGLAVDLVDSNHVQLDEGAERTKGYKWLVKNCHKYGFILRYPNGATDITGIIYEPWHFRYVGEEAAAEIMEAGITLEEYLEQLK